MTLPSVCSMRKQTSGALLKIHRRETARYALEMKHAKAGFCRPDP
jgi:hypothetical protein